MNKFLIVNADDFGYSQGINNGIIEAHKNGIVTSTSVMVDEEFADDAKKLVEFENLSIGLHFELKQIENVQNELFRQLYKFKKLTGQDPDHIDTHKLNPASTGIKEILALYSKTHGIPVRGLGPAKFIDKFYGNSPVYAQGKTTPSNESKELYNSLENISVNGLKATIDLATEEYNEIMCHVGYVDKTLIAKSSYIKPREIELSSICSPIIKTYLQSKDLKLTNWKKLHDYSV